jgi:hypothetical protein
VIYDLEERHSRGTIGLPGTLSTQHRWFRPRTLELWAAGDGHPVRTDVTQETALTTLDVGGWRDDDVADFSFRSGHKICVVALYRSGVVLAVNVVTFAVTHRAETAQSLGEVALLPDGRFVAKVWRSDRFIVGSLVVA